MTTNFLKATTLALAMAVVGCTGGSSSSSSSSSSSGGGGSCGDNKSDGVAAPTTAQALTLGTVAAGSVCDDVGTTYYYWKATGPFVAADRFTLDLTLKSPQSGDSVTCYVGGAGTYSQSTGTTSVNSVTLTDQSTDIAAIESAGNPNVYVICYASTSGTDVRALSVDIKLTKQ
jgi:hypothetical protein